MKSFFKKYTIGLIHNLYIIQLKNSYKHLAFTKTKSEVRGGGRKPRPQKGQGYARSGSIRSPLWAGGGIIFGPKPHLVNKKINKKEKRLTIFLALLLKLKQCVSISNSFLINPNFIKTKESKNFLIKNKIDLNKKILIILLYSNRNLWLSLRNIKNIKITTLKSLNIKDLLNSHQIVISENVFDKLNLISKMHYE